jgi:uncharacterized protein YceH (UPF0502 family)
VLGALLEKEAATPEYYPLTLNALRNACNQSSSRSPVVNYGEEEVQTALSELRERGLARIVYSPSNRAPKYRQVIDEAMALHDQQKALVCLLLLRGPQTVAELRSRSERLCTFESLEEVERLLEGLTDRPEPLVTRLTRMPGQKEARFAQVLTGPPDPALLEEQAAERAVAGSGSGSDRLTALTRRVEELEAKVAELSEELRALLD